MSAPAHAQTCWSSGPARDPADQVCEGVRVRQRIGVQGHDERRRHGREGGVERVELAPLRLEHPPVVQPMPPRGLLSELGGAVGRVVVGQDDLEPPGVGRGREVVHGPRDGLLLVVGRDDDGQCRPLPGRPRPGRRLRRRHAIAQQHQGRHEKADQHPGDVAEQRRDDPRHDGAERLAEIRSPGRRDVDGEADVRRREDERDHEADRRTPAATRARAPREPAESRPLGRKLRHTPNTLTPQGLLTGGRNSAARSPASSDVRVAKCRIS